MPEIEVIRKIAEETLCSGPSAGAEGRWLWDRTSRILRNVEYICLLPELTATGVSIERFCLFSAACFADSGLVQIAATRGISVVCAAADVDIAERLELSARTAAGRLEGVVSAAKIEKISRIIAESGSRFTQMSEAMTLADARNLDDIGLVGLFNGLGPSAGGVLEALEGWQRKVDYGYWQARLRENFRFASVGKLAQQRFSQAQLFMDRLRAEHASADLEQMVRQSAQKPKHGYSNKDITVSSER